YRITNATFFYGALNVSDIAFVASPLASGFNVAFKNDRSAWGMRLDKVRFQGWGVGWYTDCAGANALSLHFDNCTIGLKLVGFADGGFFTGRLEHCVVGAEIGGTDLGSANPSYLNGATHANRLHFEGPFNTYVYVVGDGAVCTLGGYFEEVRDVVAIGFPPDVVNLVPGITETNKGTWSVTIDSLGGFGGSTAGHNAQSVVSIYTPALYGLAIRNSMFSALDLVRSTTAGGDSTPIVIENSLPGLITTDGTRPFPRVITYSDGTCIPTWNGERPLNAEINSQKRHYVGTNLVNDLSLGNNQLYNTVIGQTDLGFATTPDPDSVNFCTSAAITDTPTRAAVSKLCKDLKQAKLWSKFYLLYPFANATPLGCSVNLMTNTSTYTISWHGTNSSTFTPLGVAGDGLVTYGDTHFVPWWIPGANALDMAFFVYNETASLPSSSRGTFIGVKGTFRAGLDYYNAGSGVAILADGFMTTGTSSLYGVMNSDYRGLLMTQRTSSETGTLLVNWLTMPYYDNSPNSGSIGLPGNTVYILAKNDGGGLAQPAAATLAMAGISHSFTIGDWNSFRVICDNYNALLGRKAP
ncbi:MAG: hypothetical protein NT154_47060, partial [Verrucomicrobia bacterium]|nr:hypothetical protein [Verrucomicrobiota bacterium]